MHQPVLVREIINNLKIQKGDKVIDCTFGQGGHTFAIWEKIKPTGQILAIERDPVLYKAGIEKIKFLNLETKILLENGNFAYLQEIVEKKEFKEPQAILFDLGLCSWHLEGSQRGFSFQRCEFLDMRYNPFENEITAFEIINRWPEKYLIEIFRKYGEEKFASRIAKKIVREREKRSIENTTQLVEIIRQAVPAWYQRKKIHWATKVFQALRIFINQEIENLEKGLPQAVIILKKKGRLAVISYHSLEDRVVKNFFRKEAKQKILKILTKKPISPSIEEIQKNPRSRSAKLRVAEKNK